MATLQRAERLQIMLTEDELAVLDDWRFARRMPSRAAAIRELLRRGLAAEGFAFASAQTQSKEFGVIARSKRKPAALQRDGRNGRDNRDGHNGGA